jgi:cell division protein FtsB
VLLENELLKSKITELEKIIKDLTDQIALDNIQKKGKDHLRVELEIWKNRSESMGKNYIDTISSLKKQLLQDKMSFIDQIKSTQINFTNQIISLKTKYQTTIEKYEISNKKLKKENEELKKKVNKVKEIIVPFPNSSSSNIKK